MDVQRRKAGSDSPRARAVVVEHSPVAQDPSSFQFQLIDKSLRIATDPETIFVVNVSVVLLPCIFRLVGEPIIGETKAVFERQRVAATLLYFRAVGELERRLVEIGSGDPFGGVVQSRARHRPARRESERAGRKEGEEEAARVHVEMVAERAARRKLTCSPGGASTRREPAPAARDRAGGRRG